MSAMTLPPGWSSQPLGTLCAKPVYGLTETASREAIGPRFLRITDIQRGVVDWDSVPFCRCSNADLERYRIQPGDLLVARIGGTTGKTFLVRTCPQEAVFASYLIRLRPNAVHGRYLYYFCQSSQYWDHINAGKDERLKGGVNTSSLTRLPVIVPTPREQVAIADVLESIESAARNQSAIADRLQDLKAATTAKLFHEGLHGERLKETVIGPIPESWDVVRVGKCCRMTSGGTPSRAIPEYWNGDIPWVKTTEVNYRKILETEEHITRRGLDESSAKLFPAGTLLMAMYGQGVTRGRVALLGIPAATNQACAAFFPDGSISEEFLYAYFTHAYDDVRVLGHGANQQNLSLELLEQMWIPRPTDQEEQNQIFRVVDSLQRATEIAATKANRLEELFSATLQQLTTGALRVQDVEIPEVVNA